VLALVLFALLGPCPEIDLDLLVEEQRTSYAIEGSLWTIVVTTDYATGDRRASVRFVKDGMLVRHVNRDGELSVSTMYSRRIWPPGGLVVFCVRGNSGAGHYEMSQFYCIKDGQLVFMLNFDAGEWGGPVFRDFDGDGVFEWVFDNFNWYEQYHSEIQPEGKPDRFLVYKLQDDGTLRLWRELPNPDHVWLPRHEGW
jgi:hypothetical protein